ncbi:MAG: PAS domain-containing protein [Rhodococcus sp. (in: high G+C Gram-positive bacteria)]
MSESDSEPSHEHVLADMSSFYSSVVQSDRATTVHDVSGALVLFNSACSTLLGYGADELAALTSTNLIHPADGDGLTHTAQRAFSTPNGVVDTQFRLVRKDGDPVLVDVVMRRVLVGDRKYLLIESTPATSSA